MIEHSVSWHKGMIEKQNDLWKDSYMFINTIIALSCVFLNILGALEGCLPSVLFIKFQIRYFSTADHSKKNWCMA